MRLICKADQPCRVTEIRLKIPFGTYSSLFPALNKASQFGTPASAPAEKAGTSIHST